MVQLPQHPRQVQDVYMWEDTLSCCCCWFLFFFFGCLAPALPGFSFSVLFSFQRHLCLCHLQLSAALHPLPLQGMDSLQLQAPAGMPTEHSSSCPAQPLSWACASCPAQWKIPAVPMGFLGQKGFGSLRLPSINSSGTMWQLVACASGMAERRPTRTHWQAR